MRKFFDQRESRQMAVFKGWQRLFRATLAGVTLICGLSGSSAAERAQHKPHRDVTAGGFLDADEINKIVRECGTEDLREEALKKLRDAYASQKLATLQIAIAICSEHGKEDDRQDALQEYAAAAKTPYSDPIDGIWAGRRREYLSRVPPKPTGPSTEDVKKPPIEVPPPPTNSQPAADTPAPSASGDVRYGPAHSMPAEGSSLPATGSAPSATPPLTQPPGQGPNKASAQPVSPPPQPAPQVATETPPSSMTRNGNFLSRLPTKRKVAAEVLAGLFVAALSPTMALLLTDGQYTTALSCGATTLPCRLQNMPLYAGGFALSGALALGIGVTIFWPLPKPDSPTRAAPRPTESQ